jgi:dTDP-4-dehydrorhamnose 3,5-epimerase
MTFTPTPLSGSFIIDISLFKDGRGWFARTYCKNEFKQIGFSKEWLQTNHSFTLQKGTVRGMHYQLFPHQEIKLVRCIAGTVYDVIIDLRKGSSTFLQWFSLELSAANKKMLYIPEGFAHGFQTLTDNCELIYHHSELYTPSAETGIRYNDSMINISWPLQITEISERDANHLLLDNNFKGI